MKKVTLLAASVLAGLMSAQAANAAPAEFNGYMRSGVMTGKSAYGHKEHVVKLGRLGNENDTYGEMQISADIAQVDDTVWRVSTMFGLGGDGKENNWDSNISNLQFFVEVKGLLDFDKDATLWVGKKYVNREDSYIGDFYYYNVSGHGVGLDNLSLGSGKLSLSWTRKDNGDVNTKDTENVFQYQKYNNVYDDDGDVKAKDATDAPVKVGGVAFFDPDYYDIENPTLKDEKNNAYVLTKGKQYKTAKVRLNILDARYEFPVWDKASLKLGATYLKPQRDKNGANGLVDSAETVKDALNLTVELSQGFSFGWNRTVLQSFSGSSADCAWSTTADINGAGFTGQGYRLINMGETHFTENFGMFHQLNLAHSKAEHVTKKTASLVVRPYYKLTKMTKIVTELGAFVESEKYDGNLTTDGFNEKQSGQKATVAYAISPDAGNFMSRPELRFYSSYINVTKDTEGFSNLGKSTGHDLVFGAQVEAWW